MSYTHTTFGTLKTQLAGRLHDAGKVYFIDAELGAYLKEALRTWQTLTAYWRERAVFATASGTAFYDIPTQCSALRGYTLTDQGLINDIQYNLLETVNNWPVSTTWGGTDQFTMDDVSNALQYRRNQFLAETGCDITRSTMGAPSTPISRVALADNIIDVRRAAWYDTTPTYTTLWRTDEWALNAYATNWSTAPSTPSTYSITATPSISMQIAPVPLDKGSLELLCIEAKDDLDPTTGVLMNVPDDFCWIIKWGTLADLLGKDGPANDPARAQYCEHRYQMGVAIARESACIIQGELQGVPLVINSQQSLDSFDQDWRNSSGAPAFIGTIGLNLISTSPVPDGVYSVTLDVIRNAPIPATDLAYVQLGREELDAVLGYAEHIAMFKVGGAEFEATQQYWENMLYLSLNYNERLAAASRYGVALADQSRNEKYSRPRRLIADALVPRRSLGAK